VTGFLPVGDRRVTGTVKPIEAGLMDESLLRYGEDDVDGSRFDDQPPFSPYGFCVAQVRQMQGRGAEARELFEQLLACETTSAFSPKSTATSANGKSAIFRWRSRMSRSSMQDWACITPPATTWHGDDGSSGPSDSFTQARTHLRRVGCDPTVARSVSC
jgi:hypothetical protein